jgi:hypothetical protein
VRDEHATTGQVHVAVVEAAGRVKRKIDVAA